MESSIERAVTEAIERVSCSDEGVGAFMREVFNTKDNGLVDRVVFRVKEELCGDYMLLSEIEFSMASYVKTVLVEEASNKFRKNLAEQL